MSQKNKYKIVDGVIGMFIKSFMAGTFLFIGIDFIISDLANVIGYLLILLSFILIMSAIQEILLLTESKA